MINKTNEIARMLGQRAGVSPATGRASGSRHPLVIVTLPSLTAFPLALAVALLLVSAPARATDYDVGPGQPYAAIGDVPWESLAPGDRVRIHWRAAPYKEKWVIARRGTAA